MPELNPCPYCDTAEHLVVKRLAKTDFAVTCLRCRSWGPEKAVTEAAVNAWNDVNGAAQPVKTGGAMTGTERAVIEAAVEYQDHYCKPSHVVTAAIIALHNAINELHNEHDGRWEPSDE